MSFQLFYQPVYPNAAQSGGCANSVVGDITPSSVRGRRHSPIASPCASPLRGRSPVPSEASSEVSTPRMSCDDAPAAASTVAVAIDKDKNSQHAVRWAIQHLIANNPILTLIHVKQKQTSSHGSDPAADLSSMDARGLFVLYRGYCARKAVQIKEVIVEESDVAKGILEYIANNFVTTIVVGATNRNALARKLKFSDVPTTVSKSAPDFCSVYVISKGKVSSVRQARRPVVNTPTPPRQPSPHGLSAFVTPSPSELSDPSRGNARGRRRSTGDALNIRMEKDIAGKPRISADGLDTSMGSLRFVPNRESISSDTDLSETLSFGSADMAGHSFDLLDQESPGSSSIGQASRELEAEMRRLKLELKQTMEMYNTACKEAISAKKKAEELHNLKIEEARRFEEARLAEEAALAMAEVEKAKCKAAIEAAEKAQKLADMEAQRRKKAEMKAKIEATEKVRALSVLHQNDNRYRRYTIEEIEGGTEGFAKHNKIGEGGYGPVYKGTLDHTPVAIKVLRPDTAQGKQQFHQEVEVLCCMRHPNMVLLLGACPEYGCLVYEYMDFGSLEDRLLRRGKTPPISWQKRFEISAEIATALLFLHQAKPEPLVHRDLKPANILLDRNYKSKISDVGLARLVPPNVADNVTQYHMTSAAGTFCYIDPEYQQTGKLTTKSDIYSLGIMLLQIITARPAMAISHHVQTAINKGKFEEMLDRTVPDWPMEEALAYAKVALRCAEMRKKDRPDLATEVLSELNRLREFARNYESSSFPNKNTEPRPPILSSG